MKVQYALRNNKRKINEQQKKAIARLGVYQLGLSASEYLPLLKFALSTDTLADSCVIILLDWTRPWSFLESLQRWIHVVEHRINEICKDGSAGETWSRGKAIVDELREKGIVIQVYVKRLNANSVHISGALSSDIYRTSYYKPTKCYYVYINGISTIYTKYNYHFPNCSCICYCTSSYHHNLCGSSHIALKSRYPDQ